MKYINPILSVFVAIAAIILVFVVFNKEQQTQQDFGGAYIGNMTIVASSTYKVAVGPSNAVTLFSVRNDCTNRAITTYANPIMITFATSTDLSSQVLATGVFGHLQAASTTKEYDSGIYGCGLWQVFGYGASTTITVSEFAGAK